MIYVPSAANEAPPSRFSWSLHWSVPDPVPAGDPASFDQALTDLSRRVDRFAPGLAATS